MEFIACASVGEEVSVGGEDLAGFGGGFLEQFHAEASQPGGVEFFEKGGTGLSGGVEERVAAAHIGAQRVLHAHAVAEVDAVLLAGAAAIGVICAVGEKRREDAVLHVKHRHVVVDR